MKRDKVVYKGFGLSLFLIFSLVLATVGVYSQDTGGGSDSNITIYPNYRMSGPNTDKSRYSVGETVEIEVTIKRYGSGPSPSNADVTGIIYKDKNEFEKLEFEVESCVAASCQEGAPCAYEEACTFKASYRPRSSGEYTVSINAEIGGYELSGKTEFSVVGINVVKLVKLNQKFSLDEGQTAQVLEYRAMKITLEDVIYKQALCDNTDDGLCASPLSRAEIEVEVYGKTRTFSIGTGQVVDAFGAKIKLVSTYRNGGWFIVYLEEPEDDLTMSVSTDKKEYEVGEKVKISAKVSGSGAEVTAEIRGPGYTTTIKLDRGLCVATSCVCPIGTICECKYSPTSCYHEGYYFPREEGTYYVYARATKDGSSVTDSTRFVVEGGEDDDYVYTTLDRKFWLNEGQTAVITDYRNLRVELLDLSVFKCAENKNEDEAIEYSESTKCIGSAMAKLRVSIEPIYFDIEKEPRLALDYPASEDEEESPQTASGGYASGETIEYQKPGMATEFWINKGHTRNILGADITFLDVEANKARFVVSKERWEDYVDVKITPNSQSVKEGQKTKYSISVRDKHPLTKIFPTPRYTYYISVRGLLPFGLEYDRSVTLKAGEQKTITLVVDTGKRRLVPYEAKEVLEEESVPIAYEVQPVQVYPAGLAGIARTVSMKQPLEVKKYMVARKPILMASAEESYMEPTEVQVEYEVTPIEKTTLINGKGSAYRFSVTATLRDDKSVSDTEYAILYVVKEEPTINVKVPINKGWNLISLPGDGTLSRGTCSSNKEIYAFVYLKELGKYVTLKEAEKIMGEKKLREYLRTHSFWVYSFEDCYFKFKLEEATSFSELSLTAGWNFVPITRDMVGRSLEDIGEDCEFQKTYIWNPETQGWERIRVSREFSSDEVYRGFVAKVEASCDLGWGTITPPPLPEELIPPSLPSE